MPLKLIPPGARRGNKNYIILGMVKGVQHEQSTHTRDKKVAQSRLEEFLQQIESAPAATQRITFAQAAEMYRAFRRPGKADEKRLIKVVDEIGRMRVAEIRHVDLVTAAGRMFPDRLPATLNREVMRPAAAVLHYAAENGYCNWLRVKLFEEPRPETRAAATNVMLQLVAATEGRQRLLLTWLYHQGTRISQTLGVVWEHVDVARAVFRIYDKKAKRWQEFPLHADVLAQLEAFDEERVGRIFPWGNKSNVYRWLRPLTQELGVMFTPHMARHALGTRLNAGGFGLRTIMAALGHADPKSSIRYQMADVEAVRAAAATSARVKIVVRKG